MTLVEVNDFFGWHKL